MHKLRVKRRVSIALFVLYLAVGAAQAQDAAKPQIDYTPLEIAAEIVIAPDGSVESFVPESGPVPSLRTLLAQRSKDWRFVPPMWLGKPVRLSTGVIALVNLVKRPDGSHGAILRSVGLRVSRLSLPEVPRSLRRSQGTTLSYAVDIGADGAFTTRELLWPALEKRFVSLDAAARLSVDTWRAAPLRVDGQPIACAGMYWVTFRNANGPLILPDVQLKLARPDVCPAVTLQQPFISSVL